MVRFAGTAWISRLLLLLAATGLAHGQEFSPGVKEVTPPPLQIRPKTLAWKGNCLKVSIVRSNRSNSPIFLPFYGFEINSSVTDATNALGQGKGQAWLSVIGGSDIIVSAVTRLGPGEIKNDDFCLADSITVVKRENKMRRQVPVRGVLRITAAYFPEAHGWQISNAQREEMSTTPRAKWKNADRSNRGQVTIELPIPCHRGEIHPDCTVPPVVFAGEGPVLVPDTGE
jgi:hypothetical protein